MSNEPTNIVRIDGKDRRPWSVASRETLLRAAIAEISERGYEHARLVDIAARADMTLRIAVAGVLLQRLLHNPLASPDIQEYFVSRGFQLGGSSATEYKAFIEAETKKWAAIVKASGAKPD